MKIIFVCIGNFQNYILDNIKNLKLFNNNDIVVITEQQFFNYFSDDVKLIDCTTLDDCGFNNKSLLDKHFRNGFWHLCSLRFFYLYSYIGKNNLSNCIHLENDVLTYINFDNFDLQIKKNKLYVTYDCDKRVIPGIVFIPNADALKPLVKNYNFSLNDMENLAMIESESFPIFPIIDTQINKLNKNYYDFNSIFDAAAIGQYLGGMDKRNFDVRYPDGDSRGFVNETCLIKYDNYIFFWIKKEFKLCDDSIKRLFIPHLVVNNSLIRINNLHIHSKELFKFIADNPLEDKLIKKIY
jgi:hypothetical protein